MLRIPPRLGVLSVRLQHGINNPSGSTGIEHALKFNETGKRHKQDFKDYKCSGWFKFRCLINPPFFQSIFISTATASTTSRTQSTRIAFRSLQTKSLT
jgi:hypothetical protein